MDSLIPVCPANPLPVETSVRNRVLSPGSAMVRICSAPARHPKHLLPNQDKGGERHSGWYDREGTSDHKTTGF